MRDDCCLNLIDLSKAVEFMFGLRGFFTGITTLIAGLHGLFLEGNASVVFAFSAYDFVR
jgi:hypothetical protein